MKPVAGWGQKPSGPHLDLFGKDQSWQALPSGCCPEGHSPGVWGLPAAACPMGTCVRHPNPGLDKEVAHPGIFLTMLI